jgi:hypothetical protein
MKQLDIHRMASRLQNSSLFYGMELQHFHGIKWKNFSWMATLLWKGMATLSSNGQNAKRFMEWNGKLWGMESVAILRKVLPFHSANWLLLFAFCGMQNA